MEHMKKHTGKSTCPLCQQTFTVFYNMRRHMVKMHGLAREDVNRITSQSVSYDEVPLLGLQELVSAPGSSATPEPSTPVTLPSRQ